MQEGWSDDDDYLMVFDEAESGSATAAYGLGTYLPGHTLIAILGWDDFVVRNESGELYKVPTVPLVQTYMEQQTPLPDGAGLEPDERFTGKIKWYVMPIVFGGDPASEDNTIWVDLATHQQLVCWWNDLYRDTVGQ